MILRKFYMPGKRYVLTHKNKLFILKWLFVFEITGYILKTRQIKGSKKKFLLKVKTRSGNFTGHFLVSQDSIFATFGDIRSDGWQSSRDPTNQTLT